MSVQVKGSGTIGGLDEGLVISGIVTSSTQVNVGSNIKLGNAGVITATSLDISGDIDVDGHTNLDNVSVSGATTCTGGAVFLNSISLNASTNNYLYFNDNLNFTRNGHGNEVQIDSSGRVLIGNTTGGSMNAAADNLVVGSGVGHNGITVFSAADADGWLIFNDAANSNLTGSIQYNHVDNYMEFRTNTSPRLRIASDGRTLINTTAVTNTNDTLTVKRTAGSWSEMSMTVDANTTTGNYANAFVFTKSKNTYWNGLGFQSSHGHIGAIVGKRDSAGGDADQEIRIEIGGTGINASEEKTWNFKNNGNLEISGGHLKLANGYGIDFSSTSNYGTSQNETLMDYEEGGWNPTYTTSGGSAGSVSYSHQAGWYVKIGNVVWVMIDITVSSASGMSGNPVIGNHPFISNIRQGQGYYYSGTSNWTINSNFCNSKPVWTGWMMGNSNLFRIHAGDHWGSVPNANNNQTGRMSFSHYYTTDQY